HGFTFMKRLGSRVKNLATGFENWIMRRKEVRFLKGFLQYLSNSDLITELNNGYSLNSSIRWFNAIAEYDFVIYDSAKLPEELEGGLMNLEQREFNAHHFKIPYAEVFADWVDKEKGLARLKRLESSIEIIIKPPIYRSREVFDWIFDVKDS
ncbi:MAG: hypothetical protein ACFFD4_29025, partial [Candidatus Odinarchaeota archaeon]